MRKYLEDLFDDDKWSLENSDTKDSRAEKWKKEREIYGFDDRDTWNLDNTMLELLYERLKMFKESSGIVDHTVNIININDKKIPFSQVIDTLIEDCEVCLKNFYTLEKDQEEILDLEEKIWDTWSKSFKYFWW